MLTRLQQAHAKFLESCRSLTDGRGYWDGAGPVRKWFAQLITPVPLLALDDDGKNLYEALLWLEAHCRTKELGEDLVRQYHRLLRPKSPEPPGEYRKGTIVIEGSVHVCPPPQRVAPLMTQFDATLRREQKRLDGPPLPEPSDILRTAVDLHLRLVLIHPFADANGRVARLLMNHVLRRYGQGYVILPALSSSREHFEALQEAHRGDLSRLIVLAKNCSYGP